MSIDYTKLTTEELLEALEWAGRYPHPDLIRACLERREDITPGLLKMLAAPFEYDWPLEYPHWSRNAHAGLLLIAFQEREALPVFGKVYRDHDLVELQDWFDVELPSYGPMAIEFAANLLKDRQLPEHSRVYGADLLAAIAWNYPNERVDIVELLRAQLPELGDDGKLRLPSSKRRRTPYLWSNVVVLLAELRDTASRPIAIALFSACMMDESVTGSVEDYLDIFDTGHPPELAFEEPFDIFETYETIREIDLMRDCMADDQEFTFEDDDSQYEPVVPARGERPGRNEPCPCGSGRKYKECCGRGH